MKQLLQGVVEDGTPACLDLDLQPAVVRAGIELDEVALPVHELDAHCVGVTLRPRPTVLRGDPFQAHALVVHDDLDVGGGVCWSGSHNRVRPRPATAGSEASSERGWSGGLVPRLLLSAIRDAGSPTLVTHGEPTMSVA